MSIIWTFCKVKGGIEVVRPDFQLPWLGAALPTRSVSNPGA
ncbi:MAG: hypothetical protein RSE65_21570 [Hafnia sp.]